MLSILGYVAGAASTSAAKSGVNLKASEAFGTFILSIKTPQLIGIIAGCIVFTITIMTVIYLLYMSGSFSKLLEEMRSDSNNSITKKTSSISPQFSSQPELYDSLLNASASLPTKPRLAELSAINTILRPYNGDEEEVQELIRASNGEAVFGESEYDSARIWGWLGVETTVSSTCNDQSKPLEKVCWPTESVECFKQMLDTSASQNGCHLVVWDRELRRRIGMLSLIDNDVKNLSVKIDALWITPAFQSKKRAHEAVYLVLSSMFDKGYRRICFEIDERHIIGRKFLQRCGFILESILRKHRIVQRRNRNTAVYVILNSEWPEIQRQLKTYLGISLKPVAHKIAEIDDAIKSVPLLNGSGAISAANNFKKRKTKKRDKQKRRNAHK